MLIKHSCFCAAYQIAHMRTHAAGALAIVNLQATQHDNKAIKSGGVVIHSQVDSVMRRLAAKLNMPFPRFVRHDAVSVGHQRHGTGSSFTVFVQSVHGPKCPLVMVEAAEFGFEVRRGGVALGLQTLAGLPTPACCCRATPPWRLRAWLAASRPFACGACCHLGASL